MGLSGCIFLTHGWVKPTSPTWCSFPKAANAEVVLVYKYRVYSLNQLQPLLEQGHPELVSRTMSGWLLNISKDGDCTASLGSLLQRLTTLAVKKGDFSPTTSRTKWLELSGQQQGSQSQGKTWITAESFNGAAFLPVYLRFLLGGTTVPLVPNKMIPDSFLVLKERLISVPMSKETGCSSTKPGLGKLTV